MSKTSSLRWAEDLAPEPTPNSAALRQFGEDVRRGLTREGQKEIHSQYLYDAVGSALFDVITFLPEYGLCRADTRLLQRHSGALPELAGKPSLVVELGSGSGLKTPWVLSAMSQKNPITYCPVDISESALYRCCRELGGMDSVRIVPFVQSYLDGLRAALRLRTPGTSAVVLFLGSTLGNFEPDPAREFLSAIRACLRPGDLLLLSTDLEKDVPRMIAAYDDPIGATAAFNLNLLARINRELDGRFVLSRFEHEARYNAVEHRIEMHLKSNMNQAVPVGKNLVVSFKRDETIWTESSYKFRCEDVQALAVSSGFGCITQWVDEEWPFAQSVLRAD